MINEFDMAGVTTIHSEIDDISGAKVKTILTSKFQTERYNCKFNAGQLSGGVGLYKLSTIKSSEEKKIISSNWCFIWTSKFTQPDFLCKVMVDYLRDMKF